MSVEQQAIVGNALSRIVRWLAFAPMKERGSDASSNSGGMVVMTERVKLPRKLSQEPGAPAPLRSSHERIIEDLELWANSSGLQPPTSIDVRNGESDAGSRA